MSAAAVAVSQVHLQRLLARCERMAAQPAFPASVADRYRHHNVRPGGGWGWSGWGGSRGWWVVSA